MNKNKIFSLCLIAAFLVSLITVATLNIYIDPYFHYHAPNKKFIYQVNDERYQNDGMMRNLNYDAMIIGSSMVKNFKTSEFDSLFNVKSIKVPFSSGSYKEINDNINKAIKYNKDLKYVVRAVDYNFFYTNKDLISYDTSYYPTYLYNENLFDDVNYVLNKSIFFDVTLPTLSTYRKNNKFIINFDEYDNFNNLFVFGKESVLSKYKREKLVKKEQSPSEKEIKEFKENINVNLVDIAIKNPNIQFYYFFPPYSILWWDNIHQNNTIDKHFFAEKMVIESLMKCSNVHLYTFTNEFDIVTKLDNYMDLIHYNEDINSYILASMKSNKNLITKSNYKNYLKNNYNFYSNYNYNDIFSENDSD